MRTIVYSILGTVAVLGIAILIAQPALSFSGTVTDGVQAARGTDVPSVLLGDGGVVTMVVNALLFVVGFLSVIMLIFGGLRYIVSGGNASAVTAAKNTILYAIVGLIIAIFAYAIVNFVIGSITGGATGGTNV